MDWMTTGADIGTMVTGLSAVTAAYVWTRTQWRGWRQQKAATSLRNWHGYITVEGIDTWYVRLAKDPKQPTARVVLDVVDREGNPDAALAHNVRQRIIGDGMLSRSPTPEEYDFLIAQRKERGYGKGFPIR